MLQMYYQTAIQLCYKMFHNHVQNFSNQFEYTITKILFFS